MEINKGQNPANTPARRKSEVARVPMSLPNLKLAVPDIPGFFLYWHRGKDVNQALRASYTFVDADELDVEQRNVANDAAESGSTDMGSRISIESGLDDTGREPERLYLMKLPNDLREQDLEAMADRNEQIAIALRAGTVGAEDDPDRNRRYMKAGQDLFYPKRRK
jgi:hypothetical protein